MAAQVSFKLSRDFQDKADAADIMSYRLVQMDITYHMPDFPHLVQTFGHQLYDRMEVGLEDLILIRAALENPNLAPYLIRYLSTGRTEQPVAGQLDSLKKTLRGNYSLNEKDRPLNADAIDSMIARTDREMDRRLVFLHDFTEGFQIRFDKASDAANIGNLEFAPETRYLLRSKAMLHNWLTKPVKDRLPGETETRPLQAIAPLKTVNMGLRLVTAWKELEEARKNVDNAMQGSTRLLIMGGGTPKIQLH